MTLRAEGMPNDDETANLPPVQWEKYRQLEILAKLDGVAIDDELSKAIATYAYIRSKLMEGFELEMRKGWKVSGLRLSTVKPPAVEDLERLYKQQRAPHPKDEE